VLEKSQSVLLFHWESSKKNGMCLSLIIPVHDREATITEEVWSLAQAAAKVQADWELVMVDRGSRDRTPEILERLRHHEPRLNLVYQCRQKSVGEALRSGFLHARGEVMVALDRPGEWDMARLGDLVAGLESSDLVAGFRRKGPRLPEDVLTSVLFGWLLGLPRECRESGVLAMRRDLWQKINFTEPGREAFWEIPARVVRSGCLLSMLPVPFFPRDPTRDLPLGPTWRTCLRLAGRVRHQPKFPLFNPVHEASTAQLRLEFLAGQGREVEGRLSLEG
jgi:hypothetical protein